LRRVLLKLREWRSLRSEEGVTAIEYALIAGITVLAIVAGVTMVGINLTHFFTNLAGRFPT
jgi:Flp pilus assembly pilin Flp